MKGKVLPIVMALMLILTIGFASAAYDLAITDISVDPTTVIEDVPVAVAVTVKNLGPHNYSPSLGDGGELEIQYGTGDTDTTPVDTQLGVDDEIVYDYSYTYNSAGTYDLIAALINMNNDTTSSNDEDLLSIIVQEQTYAASVGEYSLSTFRGTTDSQTRQVSNDGNVDLDVEFVLSDLTLQGESETLSSAEVSLSNTGVNIPVGESYDLVIETTPGLSRTPGTYAGTLNVELANGTVLDTSNVEVLVKNNVPTITAINDQVLLEGVEFTYQVVADDVEGETLDYSVSGPSSDMVIDSTGYISGWTPTGVQTVNVVVTVNDGYDDATENFQIEVLEDIPRINIVEEDILIGGSEQERGVQLTKTVTIKNTGTQDLENITVSLSGTGSTTATFPSRYEGSVSIGANTLSPGDTTTATIFVSVPENQDARQSSIGRVVVSADGEDVSVSDNEYIQMQAKSYLRIKEIVVEVDGNDESLDDGETYDEDEFEEDAFVEVTIILENTYNEDDFEIEDAYVEMISDEDDWDIDDESDEDDIREDDDEEFTITFTIGDDLDEESTDIVVEAFGDDKEYGFEHYDKWTINFEIEKEDDEITIRSWDIENAPVTCDDRYVFLEVEIENTGTDDQDEVMLEVTSENDELDYVKRIRDIELDSDDSETYTFQIPIDDIKEGSYFVNINTYYDSSDESDSETINVDIGPCGASDEDDDDADDDDQIVTPPVVTPPVVTPPVDGGQTPIYGQPVSSTEKFTSSAWYIVLLVVLVVLLLAILILLIMRLLR